MGVPEEKESLEEIYMERAIFLQNPDRILLEELDKSAGEITDSAKYPGNTWTYCCGILVDIDKAPMARAPTGEQLLVCGENCRKVI